MACASICQSNGAVGVGHARETGTARRCGCLTAALVAVVALWTLDRVGRGGDRNGDLRLGLIK